jgi:hypothetical protein
MCGEAVTIHRILACYIPSPLGIEYAQRQTREAGFVFSILEGLDEQRTLDERTESSLPAH